MKNLITYFIAVCLLSTLKVTSQTWSPVANGVSGGNPSAVYSLSCAAYALTFTQAPRDFVCKVLSEANPAENI